MNRQRIQSMPPPRKIRIEIPTSGQSTPRRASIKQPDEKVTPLLTDVMSPSVRPFDLDYTEPENMQMARRPTLRSFKKRSVREKYEYSSPLSASCVRRGSSDFLAVPSNPFSYPPPLRTPSARRDFVSPFQPDMSSPLGRRMSRISLLSEDKDIENANVFINAMNDQRLQQVEEDAEKSQANHQFVQLSKIPSSNLMSQPAMMDSSDIFPSDVGTNEGTVVFRIENLKPARLQPHEVGSFCVADSYIVLVTESIDNQFVYKIYTWIGTRSETDKKFCCAMYATSLRSRLQTECMVSRQDACDEDQAFLDLFENFDRLDASHGTQSGLYMALGKAYPVKLYQLEGGRDVRLLLVPKSLECLNSNFVYILDAGLSIYQWNGVHSSLQHRSKARMISHRINHAERANKGQVYELNEGEEPSGFIDLLDESIDGTELLDEYTRPPILYSVPRDSSAEIEENIVGKGKLNSVLLNTNECRILDSGTEVYLWIGKASSKTTRANAREFIAFVIKSRPRPIWMSYQRVVEGAETEVFKLHFCDWDSKKTQSAPPVSSSSKTNSPINSEPKADLSDLYNYVQRMPCNISETEDIMQTINSYLEAFTSFVFQQGKFVLLPAKEKGHYYAEDAYVFLCIYRAQKEVLDKLLRNEDSEVLVSTVSATPRKPTWRVSKATDETGSSQASDAFGESMVSSEEDSTLECVVYFCQTSKTNKVAFSTFTMQTQKEMEQLVWQMYGCKVVVQKVDFGNEPFALLAHLENNYVLHRGSRKKNAIASRDHTKLFQIRMDHQHGTTRAIEIPLEWKYLSSVDCYFIFNPNNDEHFLWKGANVKSHAFEGCIGLVNAIIKYTKVEESVPVDEKGSLESIEANLPESVRVCEYETEPEEFYSYFVVPPQHVKLYFVIPSIFICNSLEGYFKVSRLPYLSQTYMNSNSCVIIDPGYPDPISLWIGSDVTETVLKLTKKSIQVWLETKKEKLYVDTDSPDQPIIHEFQSQESIQFQALFQAWDPNNLTLINPGNEFTRSFQQASPMLFPK